jgi:hypothetical protein
MKHPSTGEDIIRVIHTLKFNYKHKHEMFSQMLGLDSTSFSFVTGDAPKCIVAEELCNMPKEIIWKLYLVTNIVTQDL